LRIFLTPLFFGAPAPYVPFEFHGEVKRQKLVMGLLSVVKPEGCMILTSTYGQTDRQTDGRTDGRAIAGSGVHLRKLSQN